MNFKQRLRWATWLLVGGAAISFASVVVSIGVQRTGKWTTAKTPILAAFVVGIGMLLSAYVMVALPESSALHRGEPGAE